MSDADDEIREQVMAHLAESFNRALYDSPEGPEHARGFVGGDVVFLVSRDGVDVRRLSLGTPSDN